jgi:myo-inositol-1(or 4)-monophosphatase
MVRLIMHPLVTIAVRGARAAAQIIVRGLDGLDKVGIQTKGDHDFVTSVDKAAEEEIIATIRKSYPNHAILAEESGHRGPRDPEVTWIIDPLDGTLNFIHGIPHFCVSIGIEVKGRLEHGVIYDPLKDELFWASRGRGAILNDRRIRVSQHSVLDNAMLGTGFPYTNDPALIEEMLAVLSHVMPKVSGLRRAGSAALDLAYVAAGRFDAFWEYDLKPWDIAAGTLLVREAGGCVTTLDGEEHNLEQKTILATNPKFHKLLLNEFQTIKTKLEDKRK